MMDYKILVSVILFLIFLLVAGLSCNDSGPIVAVLVILALAVVCLISYVIGKFVMNRNKKKRMNMLQNVEDVNADFDALLSVGDDRCKIYFNTSKKKLLILRVKTENIIKKHVDGFECPCKDYIFYNPPTFSVYDPIQRQILSGFYKGDNLIFKIYSLDEMDENNGVGVQSIVPPIYKSYTTWHYSDFLNKKREYTIFVEESHALVVKFKKEKLVNAFNYIEDKERLAKTRDKSYIAAECVGNYFFIMDDFLSLLVIVATNEYKIFNYSDIVGISYEENGNDIYSKSAGRIVGGAIAGGLLAGGAGAVVGGLSSSSKVTKEVATMDLKVLLRDKSSPTYILHFKEIEKILNTKEDTDDSLYHIFLENAMRAKDLFSLIIDSANRTHIQSNIESSPVVYEKHLSIADELSKLAKLRSDGIITDEEFVNQKQKLLDEA